VDSPWLRQPFPVLLQLFPAVAIHWLLRQWFHPCPLSPAFLPLDQLFRLPPIRSPLPQSPFPESIRHLFLHPVELLRQFQFLRKVAVRLHPSRQTHLPHYLELSLPLLQFRPSLRIPWEVA